MMSFSYTSDQFYDFCLQRYYYRNQNQYQNQYQYQYHNYWIEESLLWSFVGLVQAVACELIASGQSKLLSLLCVGNQIECELDCFSVSIHKSEQLPDYSKWTHYDLYPIAQCVLALFEKKPEDFYKRYCDSSSYLFEMRSLGKSREEEIPGILKDIDAALRELKRQANPQQIQDLITRCDRQTAQIKEQEEQLAKQTAQIRGQEEQLAKLKQQLENQGQQPAAHQEPLEEKPKSTTPLRPTAQTDDSVSGLSFSERLKVFASSRQREEDEILQKIQQLRSNLQFELQEITKIREGLEFETLQESISQILVIHGQLWDILEMHPMADSDKGYGYLVNFCRDLRENVVESLAMLGVTYIDGTGGPYEPSKHCTQPGVRPTRTGKVSKVLRPGFSYRSKVFEKAIVELQ